MVQPLRHRDFRLLWSGQTISFIGNGIFSVALPFEILRIHGTALQLGIAFTLVSFSALVALLFGGVIVDRVPRRRVVLASDLANGLFVAVLAGLGLTGNLRIEVIYVSSAGIGLCQAFYLPAMSSILPDLIPADVLVAGNSLRGLSQQLNRVIGPLIGGFLVSATSPAAGFAVDAITFFVSFAVFLLANEPPLVRQTTRFWAELREGVTYAHSIPWIWITIWAFAVINVFAWAPISVGLPLLVHQVIGGGARAFGIIGAGAGIGQLVAGLISGQFRVKRLGVFLYMVVAVEGIALIAVGLVPVLAVAVLANVAFGAAVVLFTARWDAALQRLVPRNLLGRVTSLDWFGAMLLAPVGPVLIAVAAERAGIRTVFIACGAVVAAVCAGGALLPPIRQLRDEPAPAIAIR